MNTFSDNTLHGQRSIFINIPAAYRKPVCPKQLENIGRRTFYHIRPLNEPENEVAYRRLQAYVFPCSLSDEFACLFARMFKQRG